MLRALLCSPLLRLARILACMTRRCSRLVLQIQMIHHIISHDTMRRRKKRLLSVLRIQYPQDNGNIQIFIIKLFLNPSLYGLKTHGQIRPYRLGIMVPFTDTLNQLFPDIRRRNVKETIRFILLKMPLDLRILEFHPELQLFTFGQLPDLMPARFVRAHFFRLVRHIGSWIQPGFQIRRNQDLR